MQSWNIAGNSIFTVSKPANVGYHENNHEIQAA